MAVKKKAPVKKKATAKKAAPKKVAKKAVAKKKAPAKRAAKKAVAKKKAAPKKVAKKAVAKKKAPAKKIAKKSTAKKVAKKAPAKRVAKKAPAKRAAASTFVVPPVPNGSSRPSVNVSTTPVAPVKAQTATKPSAAPRQGSSKGVLIAVLLGVVVLAAIVIAGQSKDSDDAPVTPAPTMSAAPTESTEPTPESTEAAVASGDAPTKFIGNWKSGSDTVMVLSWAAPAGDVTGYKVEISYNGGSWSELAALPATALSQEVSKVSSDTYTSFRVSAIYSDGSMGTAKAFGFKGEFK